MTLGNNFSFLSLFLFLSHPACFLHLSHSLKTVFDYFNSNYMFRANVTSAVAAEEWKGEENQIITAKTIVLPATQPCLHQIWGMGLPSCEGHIIIFNKWYVASTLTECETGKLWTKVPRKKVHLQICKTDQLELQWPWSSWNIIGPESNCNLCWILFSSLHSHSFPSLCGPNILWITDINLLEGIRKLQLPPTERLSVRIWYLAYRQYCPALLQHLLNVCTHAFAKCSLFCYCKLSALGPGIWHYACLPRPCSLIFAPE